MNNKASWMRSLSDIEAEITRNGGSVYVNSVQVTQEGFELNLSIDASIIRNFDPDEDRTEEVQTNLHDLFDEAMKGL